MIMTEDRAKELMDEWYIGKNYLTKDVKVFDEYNELYRFIQNKYCKDCKYSTECDWVPMSCPLNRFRYGDKLEEIEKFNIETFDPIKYYWGESQGD